MWFPINHLLGILNEKFALKITFVNFSNFISLILQFQLYRALCKTAGEYVPNNNHKPLYKCDFYKSIEAGKRLR